MPLLLWGFAFNILISIAAMAVGTVAGVPVGIGQLSQWKAVRIGARVVTQLFRNSPWLVLLFLCVFLIPFEIRLFGLRIPFPDWAKAILGFSLPVMANTSETRARRHPLDCRPDNGTAPRRSASSRWQTLSLVILPQSVKRMLPPWMNLYSLIAMSTVNASIVGVNEMITLTSRCTPPRARGPSCWRRSTPSPCCASSSTATRSANGPRRWNAASRSRAERACRVAHRPGRLFAWLELS